MMHVKVGLDQQLIYSDLGEQFERLAQKLDYTQIVLMYDRITEAHKKLNQNVNPTLVFEQIVINGVK